MNYEREIISCIESSDNRMKALRAVRSLNLPDSLIAAGFVRNAIWDKIYSTSTTLNDIDVIYFYDLDLSTRRDKVLEEKLRELEPDFPWSVKNQARMHVKNGDNPYRNTLDAMSYWPEKQTSIGVLLDSEDNVCLKHCFDLSFQFNGKINQNPKREIEIFNARVKDRAWRDSWPKLEIEI